MRDEKSPNKKLDKKLDHETRMKLKGEIEPSLLKEIKQGTKTIYLDGNNMLFVDEKLRKLSLNHKRSLAERLIANLATEFGKKNGLENIILIFDKTNNVYSQSFDSLKLSVCSATPNFKTSDDALVDWMGGLSAFDSTLIVTSDVGLQIRLKEKGVQMIMKSGAWFKLVKKTLSEEKYAEIVSLADMDTNINEMKNLSINK